MKLRLKEVPLQLAISYQAGTNLLLVSKPGIGKSATILRTAERIAAKDDTFQYVSFDLSTCSPIDFGATMPNRDTGTLDYFPNSILPNGYKDPDWHGIVNISEMLNADNVVGKLMQKYINGESINGKLIKPKRAVIFADSNRLVDKSGVVVQSRALMNRFEQCEVYTEPADNLEFAEESGFHEQVVGFMKDMPHCIDNYEQAFGLEAPSGRENAEEKQRRENALEEGKRGIWACMRGWERISHVLRACEALNKPFMPQRAFGSVGFAVGQQFMVFREQMLKLASLQDIINNPKGVALPTNVGEIYATLLMIANRVELKDVKAVGEYIDRVQGDLRVVALRKLQQRANKTEGFKGLFNTPTWKTWLRDPAVQDMIMARG